MSTSAACPVCGGTCRSFPDTEHAADYPFLPGGVTVMAEEKTHTATGRMFDGAGVLAAIAGDRVADSVWKTLTAEKDYPLADNGAAAEQASTTPAKKAPAKRAAKKAAAKKAPADAAPAGGDQTPPGGPVPGAADAAGAADERAPARETR